MLSVNEQISEFSEMIRLFFQKNNICFPNSLKIHNFAQSSIVGLFLLSVGSA